jgi:hypothetical protein
MNHITLTNTQWRTFNEITDTILLFIDEKLREETQREKLLALKNTQSDIIELIMDISDSNTPEDEDE